MGMVKYSQNFQNSEFAISLQYLKKEVTDEVDFSHAEKHKSCPQVDFYTFVIKVLDKMMLSLLMAWSNIHKVLTATSLQYLCNISKKKGRDSVEFLRIIFYKLVLLFLMEVVRYVESTQNKKLVIVLEYLKRKVFATAFLFYCDVKHSDILWWSSHVRPYLLFNKTS